MKNHHVVVLAYDQLCTFEFGCVVEVFGLSRPELNVNWYRLSVCAVDRGPLRAAGGIHLKAPYQLSLLDEADTIVIPGWRNLEAEPPRALIQRLRQAHERGTRIAAICSGGFLLAATGLLNGKSATTHWKYAAELSIRYPEIRIEANALYVDEGQLMTSAGSAAGLDMMLHLIRRDHGAKVANSVAQRLVVSPHREGGQAQFIPTVVTPSDARGLSKLMDWLRAHLAQPHNLASMAHRAHLTPRTLQRRFREITAMTPIEWLYTERVRLAKDLLETSSMSLGGIVMATGFGSEESLRKHFRRLVQTSPIAYRRQFG
jgi:AraC family transcriptional regulator, transcriptional activator FtrA